MLQYLQHFNAFHRSTLGYLQEQLEALLKDLGVVFRGPGFQLQLWLSTREPLGGFVGTGQQLKDSHPCFGLSNRPWRQGDYTLQKGKIYKAI